MNSNDVKEYLVRGPAIAATAGAELYAYVLARRIATDGHPNQQCPLAIDLPLQAVAQRARELIGHVFGSHAMAAAKLSKSRAEGFCVQLDEPGLVREILAHYGLSDIEGHDNASENGLTGPRLAARTQCAPNQPDISFMPSQEDSRAFLCGLFCACGYASDPATAYLIELRFRSRTLASGVQAYLAGMGLALGLRTKGKASVLYAKNAQVYATILALAGASLHFLNAQGEQTEKDMRNTMMRTINCETANMNKTVESSLRQVTAINALSAAGKLASLPETLVKTAQLRLDMPEAALSELVKASPGSLSRSTLDKRLRRLVQLAERLE